MIKPPKRAVTRFLIPFIDVLILLFCIFLLMPYVSRTDAGKTTLEDNAALKKEMEAVKRRYEELKRDRTQLFRNFRIVVLEIDSDTGELGYQDSIVAGRQRIKDQADAMRLINREKARAGEKQVSFIIRYPRTLSGFPLLSQIEEYRRWFNEMPLEIDFLPESKSP